MTDSDSQYGDLAHLAKLSAVRYTPYYVRARALDAAAIDAITTRLSHGVEDDAALVDAFEGVARSAVEVLDGVAHAGVTASVGDGPVTVTPTDTVVFAVDAAQYRLGDGPCLLALRTDTRVHLTGRDVAARWPELSTFAARAGVDRFHAAPLHVEGRCVGTINLYCTQSDAPTTGFEDDVLGVLVDYLDVALWSYSRSRDLRAGVDRIVAALTERRTVGMALGVLMMSEDLTVDNARRVLDHDAAVAGSSVYEKALHILGH